MNPLNHQDVKFCKAMVGLGLTGSCLGLLFLFSGQWHMIIGGGLFLFACLWFALTYAAIASQPQGITGRFKFFVPNFIEQYIHEQLTRPSQPANNRRDAWKRVVLFSLIAGFIIGAVYPRSPVLAVAAVVGLAVLIEVLGRRMAKRAMK